MEQGTRMEYIQELRNRLLVITIPAILIFVVLFLNYPTILNTLTNYYGLQIVNLTPTESIETGIKFSTAGALLFLFPAFVVQLIEFSKGFIPKKTRFRFYTFGFLGFLLGITGFVWGITYLSKMIFEGLLTYTIGDTFWSISSILGSAVTFGTAIAISVQAIWVIPVVCNLGIIKKERLKLFRPIILLGLLGVSAFLTPPDVLSQFIMVIPLYGSYEIGMLFTSKSNKEVKHDRN